MNVLTKQGFDKIDKLQDKYKFQNLFVIEDTESALAFLRDLISAYSLGLNIEDKDLNWINSAIDILTS